MRKKLSLLNYVIGLSLVLFCFLARAQPPELPYIQEEQCEGESGLSKCALFTKGRYKSSRALKIFSQPLGVKPVATIAANTEFEAITWRLYTLKVARCKVLEEDGDFKKGDSFYPLSYSGEGHYLVWHRGDTSAKPAWDDMAGPASRCESEKKFQTQYWTKIKYKGKNYWWPTPKECEQRLFKEGKCVYKALE